MRRIVSLVAWWALLVLLWTAYVGTIDTTEVLWGLGAAAVATGALEVVRSQRLLRFRVDRSWLARGLRTPLFVVSDFGVVTWELARALARGRRVAGRYVELPFPAGEQGRSVYAWRRAYATTLGTMGLNALVVDIDSERNVAVLHALRADLRTAREVL